MYKKLTLEEAKHMFLPVANTLYTYVVEDPTTKKITHFCGFYRITNLIIGNAKHKSIETALLWYYSAPDNDSLKQMMNDLLIMAHREGFDCMNALESMSNPVFLADLKFAEGSGRLHFYLYNWRCPSIPAHRQGFLVV
jgi:glycylpeptide N-tetradecanoyltransferase